jgi:hypothetical protein
MNHDETPMWDDPAESSALRQMLRAGRTVMNDYDVERGLARHLANLHASAASPTWATSLAAVRGASTPVLTWLVVPLVAASAFVGVWLVTRREQPPQPQVRQEVRAGETTPRVPAVDDRASGGAAQQPATALPLQAAKADANRALTVERSRATLGAKPSAHAQAPSAHHARNTESARSATRSLETAPNGAEPSFETSEPTGTHAALDTTARGATDLVARGSSNDDASQASRHDSSADSLRPQVAVAAAASNDAAATRTKDSAANAPPAAQNVQNDDGRLEREMQMLAVAQRVLTTDPARALRLAHQGDHEFPGSMFSAERKQVGLLALVQLGRLDEARHLGKPFLAAYPNAPWSERLRRALATGHIPAP